MRSFNTVITSLPERSCLTPPFTGSGILLPCLVPMPMVLITIPASAHDCVSFKAASSWSSPSLIKTMLLYRASCGLKRSRAMAKASPNDVPWVGICSGRISAKFIFNAAWSFVSGTDTYALPANTTNPTRLLGMFERSWVIHCLARSKRLGAKSAANILLLTSKHNITSMPWRLTFCVFKPDCKLAKAKMPNTKAAPKNAHWYTLRSAQ